jgi:hypothetical protein
MDASEQFRKFAGECRAMAKLARSPNFGALNSMKSMRWQRVWTGRLSQHTRRSHTSPRRTPVMQQSSGHALSLGRQHRFPSRCIRMTPTQSKLIMSADGGPTHTSVARRCQDPLLALSLWSPSILKPCGRRSTLRARGLSLPSVREITEPNLSRTSEGWHSGSVPPWGRFDFFQQQLVRCRFMHRS